MSTKSVEILISGRVQGVYFRKFTKQKGLELGVKGYVQNLASGKVRAVVVGSEDRVKSMVEWCHVGSPLSKVNEIIVTDCLESISNESFFIA